MNRRKFSLQAANDALRTAPRRGYFTPLARRQPIVTGTRAERFIIHALALLNLVIWASFIIEAIGH